MSQLVPNRLLMDFELRLGYRRTLPKPTGRLSGWSKEFKLPTLCELDGQEPFADVYACWNEDGIAVACRVRSRDKKFRCDPARFWKGDNFRVCTDMRDARDIHRATRYCQQFYLLATGGGKGKSKSATTKSATTKSATTKSAVVNVAVAGSTAIHRAKQDAPVIRPGKIEIASSVNKSGYAIEAILPAEVLNGFDPDEHPRIGFYYMLEDLAQGQQYLTVGDDLYWHIDPSTWATAVLTR